MIGYFILGLALLCGFLLLGYWFVSADPKKVIVLGRWVLAGLGLIVAGYLLWGGRQAFAALLIPTLIPLFLRYRALWRRIKAASGPTPGQTSEINTRFLKMILDHDSGVMTGRVLAGRYEGHSLDDLSLDDLIDLWRECQAEDAQSASVLEAYLDRNQGDAWRQTAGAGARESSQGASGGGYSAGQGAPTGNGMDRQEAYNILGLEPGASNQDIHEAHRRLLQKVHPDHGGSNYLAAKINQAKDLLLGA